VDAIKSAQTTACSIALVAQKPRSHIAQLLCVDSGRCDKLWTKEEEPWQKKKEAKADL